MLGKKQKGPLLYGRLQTVPSLSLRSTGSPGLICLCLCDMSLQHAPKADSVVTHRLRYAVCGRTELFISSAALLVFSSWTPNSDHLSASSSALGLGHGIFIPHDHCTNGASHHTSFCTALFLFCLGTASDIHPAIIYPKCGQRILISKHHHVDGMILSFWRATSLAHA